MIIAGPCLYIDDEQEIIETAHKLAAYSEIHLIDILFRCFYI